MLCHYSRLNRLVTLLLLGVARPTLAQCDYEVDIIEVEGFCAARPAAINELGQIAGWTNCGADRAFTWNGAGDVSYIPMPPGTLASRAYDINNQGDVVGRLTLSGMPWKGFVWDGSRLTILEPPSKGNSTDAYAVNDDGVVVGRWRNTITGPVHAAIWVKGELLDVGADLPAEASSLEDIDASGTATGTLYIRGSIVNHAFLFSDRGFADIGAVPPGSFAQAFGVSGPFVVGRALTGAAAPEFHGFRWRDSDYELTVSADDCLAKAVNRYGETVGHCSTAAFYWHNGMPISIDDLLPDGLESISSWDINDRGWIAISLSGTGARLRPRVRADLDGDCVTNVQDLLALLTTWGDSGAADFDLSGSVDVEDLLFLLADWTN